MDLIMPQLGESVSEGTIISWLKQPGDRVAYGDILFEVETDKVTTEVPALEAGTLGDILVEAGATVAVGTKVATFKAEGDAEPAAPQAAAAPVAAPAASSKAPPAAAQLGAGIRNQDGQGRPLSPAVRRLIAEHSIDIDQVSGSGKGGRPTKADILAFMDGSDGAAARPAAPQSPAPAPSMPSPPATGGEFVPFDHLRGRIAEHMVRSKATSPHVLQVSEVDFGRVDRVRSRSKADFKARNGFSLTYLPFIARAVVLALQEFPRLNAHSADGGAQLFNAVHLGFAIDLNFEGLVAPVVKNAQDLNVAGLARAVNMLAERARAGKLTPDDMSGGTYSITNNGSFGTVLTAPIINQPQVAILSTDGITRKPAVVETEAGEAIAIRPIGMLAQSFDHRIVDGSYSAAYLKRVKELLQHHDWAGEL